MQKIFLSLISLIILSSCVKRNEATYAEFYRSCESLKDELNYAKHYKRSIRENDRFSFKYMLVLPAITEIISMNRNEKEVNLKMDNLKLIMKQRGCFNGGGMAKGSGANINRSIYSTYPSQQRQAPTPTTLQHQYNPNQNYYTESASKMPHRQQEQQNISPHTRKPYQSLYHPPF